MCIMDTKAFIGNLLWTIMLLFTCCNSVTLDITDDNTTTTINSTTPDASTITTTTMTTTMSTTKVPSKISHNTLVLCECGSGQVMDHKGQCQHWEDGGTTVPMEPPPGSKQQGLQHIDTTELSVTVKEPQCHHRQIDLHEDQFILSLRGYVLVTKGTLRGLRVADYCIHHQQSGGQVKVTARGCISVPVVPRCCPLGKHIINDDCIPKPMTSMSFNPPLSTGPYGDNGLAGALFPWADCQEHLNKPSCEPGNVMKKVVLDGRKAYLAVMPKFVLLTWHSEGDQRHYSIPSQYCVDVPGNNDTYYAYSCQRDPEAYCKNKMCTNKCCPAGQALSMETKGCISSDLPFKPPFPSPPISLTTLYNYPQCEYFTDIGNFQLLQDGTLIHSNNAYSFAKFCTDIFIRDNSTEPGALACNIMSQGTIWHDIRSKLFPVCYGLSCGFLALLLLLHAWIPKLRDKEGKYQLFHAASLFLAYSVTLVIHVFVPKGYVMRGACVYLAFVKQFAFLSAFFWLNTMCYDVCRLFRNLVRNIYSPVHSVAAWKYILYALGGPLTITVITIIVQFIAPKDGSIPWLVHPHIGEGYCWFRGDKERLAYFYGPIAVLFFLNVIFIGITYHYLRIIRGDYKSTNDPSGYRITAAETTRKYDFFAAFWQRFFLLVLVAGSWVAEILSWTIPPEELWAVTDILNNLQGVFVFFVFLTHHNKRALLKKNLPKLFQFSDIWINNVKTGAQTTVKTSNKMNTSCSTIISYIYSFSSVSKISNSTSSFNINQNEPSISTSSTDIRPLSLTPKISLPLDQYSPRKKPLPEFL